MRPLHEPNTGGRTPTRSSQSDGGDELDTDSQGYGRGSDRVREPELAQLGAHEAVAADNETSSDQQEQNLLLSPAHQRHFCGLQAVRRQLEAS